MERRHTGTLKINQKEIESRLEMRIIYKDLFHKGIRFMDTYIIHLKSLHHKDFLIRIKIT